MFVVFPGLSGIDMTTNQDKPQKKKLNIASEPLHQEELTFPPELVMDAF